MPKKKSKPRRTAKSKKVKSKPKVVKKITKIAKPTRKPTGTVIHFYDKISVAVVKLESELRQGDKIEIVGPRTNVKQAVASMQIEHEQVKIAKKGQSVGLKVKSPVREMDLIFKI